MSKYLLLPIILFYSLIIVAQQTTENQKASTIIQNRFPKARTFFLEYDRSFYRNFSSEISTQDFAKGDITSQQAINFSVNMPLYKYKKWLFSTSGNFKGYQFQFNDLKTISDEYTLNQKQNIEFYYLSLAVNSTLFGSLFNKLLIYNGSVIVDGSEKGIERVKGFVSASLLLKRSEHATITIGLLSVLDLTSQIPFAPIFSYNQKFRQSNWEFDLILPQRISFKKPLGQKSRLTLGTFLDSDAFYVKDIEVYLPDTYAYSQLKINGGVIYEYLLSSNAVVTLQGGASQFISNRLTEKKSQNRDYIAKNNQEITGYFSISISLNPFKKLNY